MRRFEFTLIATALILIGTLMACAHMTGPGKDALSRVLGRRIAHRGSALYPGIFIDLGITANQACPQRTQKATPADLAFTLIVKAIETQTDDPFLAQDLKDVIQIMGIDLDQQHQVVNLTPEIRDTLLQFVCSFAQGVDRAKRNL